MEIVLLFGNQIFHDLFRIKGYHVLIQRHTAGKKLIPVIICLPVIIDEHRRIDSPAGQPDRIPERPLRLVGDRNSLHTAFRTEIEIIVSVLLDAVRRKQQRPLLIGALSP